MKSLDLPDATWRAEALHGIAPDAGTSLDDDIQESHIDVMIGAARRGDFVDLVTVFKHDRRLLIQLARQDPEAATHFRPAIDVEEFVLDAYQFALHNHGESLKPAPLAPPAIQQVASLAIAA